MLLVKAKNALLISLILFCFACSKESDPQTLAQKQEELALQKQRLNKTRQVITKLESEIQVLKGVDITEKRKAVSIQEVQPQLFSHYVRFPGKVQSDANVLVTSEWNGTLKKQMIKVGKAVTKGEVIVRLDSDLLEKQREELETQLRFAVLMFEKQSALWSQKIGTELQYLQAKNNKETLETKMNTLKEQISKTRIKSPISGVIDEYFVKVGEMAAAGMPLARVIQNKKLKVIADVSEKYSLIAKKSIPVQIGFPNLGIELKSKIGAIGSFINPKNNSFMIEVPFENTMSIKINSTAMVTFSDFSTDSALVLKDYLLQRDVDGTYFIYIAKENTRGFVAKKVKVKTGKSYQGKTMILAGIQSGDQVIEEGYTEVTEGQLLNIIQ